MELKNAKIRLRTNRKLSNKNLRKMLKHFLCFSTINVIVMLKSSKTSTTNKFSSMKSLFKSFRLSLIRLKSQVSSLRKKMLNLRKKLKNLKIKIVRKKIILTRIKIPQTLHRKRVGAQEADSVRDLLRE